MKQKSFTLLLVVLMSMAADKALAYDIEVENADGMKIFYNYINEGKELEVVTQGRWNSDYYRGNLNIPAEVTYLNRTRKVTSIDKSTFKGCRSLTSVTIPQTVIKIGEGAFYDCSHLTSVTISNNVKTIEENTFYGCKALTSVVIPSSVTTIGEHAFDECRGLTSVTIPNSVTTIGEYAFSLCVSLTSVTIPNSITTIGKGVFGGCWSLTSVTIPNGVTTIGEDAFSSCFGLISVTIPNSVTSIESLAFNQCSKLEKVIVKDIASWCRIKFGGDLSNPLRYAKHIFSDENTEITNLVIPNSVTSIGDYAFNGCSGLTSVTIPNSVIKIGRYAFEYCSGLTSVTIPNSVTAIEDNTFYGCKALTSVTIPNSVTTIGSLAFNCENLVEVVSLIKKPFIIRSESFAVFSKNTFNNATLYVPAGTIDAYKTTDGWKSFIWIEEGTPTGVSELNVDAMPTSRYSLEGQHIREPKNGINIIKMSDGTTKKVLVK